MSMGEGRPNSILVAYASRHGATEGIARRIGNLLTRKLTPEGWRVEVAKTDNVEDFIGYEAVILGSAIYLGRWLRSATQLFRHMDVEPPLGLWLFSSGPVDDSAGDAFFAPVVAGRAVRDSVVFAGRIDRASLGGLERAVTAMVRVEDGDSATGRPLTPGRPTSPKRFSPKQHRLEGRAFRQPCSGPLL